MRAIVIEQPGGPEVLRPREVTDPRPGPGQVVVDVGAAGVNFIDIYQRTGVYPVPTPYTPGLEGAGTVSAVGAGVTDLAEGQRVAWVSAPGGYAERAAVPVERVVPVPDGVTTEQAAAVMLQGLTAHYLTHATYPVRSGDSVLVHAAAGGTGLLLVQLAKARGARVIGTVSTEAKEQQARAAGADEIIRYTEVDDVAAAVRELTGGAGVAAVFDGVGADTFDASLASLRRRGVLALFGQSSGVVPTFDPQRLNTAGSVFLARPNLADHIVDRAELLERANDILGLVDAGKLRVEIGGRYPLADAARAHEDLAARRTTGKLLLV
ncbi:quinone oxidoreductase [Nocardiopsis gilva YIM 90087]|uniref:Quinone oxidoreductase n=1 Tax=Nocardiopsis gilva YIM 90087 TaxID=1235441 RepID=A0A223S4I0_9ACTN|nr:quinone oxidoreductase [Nocardiopsis gilva]ASU83034.1 quinone oxidoreductase [Nocardiopsis gilva YIM 90087]